MYCIHPIAKNVLIKTNVLLAKRDIIAISKIIDYFVKINILKVICQFYPHFSQIIKIYHNFQTNSLLMSLKNQLIQELLELLLQKIIILSMENFHGFKMKQIVKF
jgi:hypothetical protein